MCGWLELEAPQASEFTIQPNYPRLEEVNHTLSLSREDYKRELKEQQKILNKLELEMYIHRVPMMIMYEGWDAAGKGGSIKRVAQALDARSYTIFTSPAPTKIRACPSVPVALLDTSAESRPCGHL